MTRKKITLAYIANKSDRRASYKKRKKGLIKKVSQLTILCDVPACVVVGYPSGNDDDHEVWPSYEVAAAMYSSLNELDDEDQAKKVVTQEEYMSQEIKKVKDKVSRLQGENNRTDMELFVSKCIAGKASMNNLEMSRRAELRHFLNRTMGDINAMLEGINIQLDLTKCPRPSKTKRY